MIADLLIIHKLDHTSKYFSDILSGMHIVDKVKKN